VINTHVPPKEKEINMNKTFSKINTKLGNITLAASEDAITGIYQEGQKNRPTDPELGEYVGHKAFEDVEEQLQEYLEGYRKQFNLLTIQHGSPFQQQVWRALTKIPYGETVTYTQLAEMIGSKNAVRAVATAVAQNPLTIVVPCHRVLSVNGEEKYSSSALHKKQLLEIEKQTQLITSSLIF
jgi:methylated-DNA-[protein]-cysteine S-methyltransferase